MIDSMCSRCGIRPNSTTDRYCKPCRSDYSREHYARTKGRFNPARYQRRQRHVEAMRRLVNEAKSVPCVDCGQVYPSYVMDFDHLTDKFFTIAECMWKSEEELRAEMDKCDVVCANCHRIRTHA